MERETAFSKEIDIAGAKANLDRACKLLLSEKSILAWIMKSCVQEYKNCTVKEIAEKYIEGTPEVGQTAVFPNETNAGSGRIRGSATEDASLNERTIFYDIRFHATAPGTGEPIRLIINIEAQNRFRTEYPLMKRVVYYMSRLISSQYTTEFDRAQYGKLKKVYSIWICMNPPQDRINTITQYSITEKDIIGAVHEKPENYDLMTAVILCLGRIEESGNDILRLLNVLLSKSEPAAEKRRILSSDYEIAMTHPMDEGVNLMCNYSEYVEEDAIARGMEKGIKVGMEKGMALGAENTLLGTIRSLMQSMKWTVEEAMSAMQIPEDERPRYAALVAGAAQ